MLRQNLCTAIVDFMSSCRSFSLITAAVCLSTASTVVLWSSAAVAVFDVLKAPLAAGFLDGGWGRRLPPRGQQEPVTFGQEEVQFGSDSFQWASDDSASGDGDGMGQMQNTLMYLMEGFTIASAVVSLAVPIMVMVLAAYLYSVRVTKKRAEWQGKGGSVNRQTNGYFRTGICGCLDSLDYCCASLWCFLPRVADTASAVGVRSFWQTVGVIIGIDVLGMLVGLAVWGVLGGVVAAVGRIAFLAVTRVKIRRALGLHPSMTPSDVLLWCCCPCCAAIQEAREVDSATGTKFQWCCAVTTRDDAQLLVGEAVQSQGSPQEHCSSKDGAVTTIVGQQSGA